MSPVASILFYIGAALMLLDAVLYWNMATIPAKLGHLT